MPEMTAAEAAKIERFQKVICWIEYCHNGNRKRLSDADMQTLRTAASILRRVASGELAPVVHGRWEEVEPGHDILFRCSKCGRVVSTSWGSCEDEDTHGNNGCDPTEEWLCCPTCGALMDGDSHA